MAKTTPAKFIRETRQEMNRVTWPKRKETSVSTGMVLLLMTLTALFFMLVDGIFGSIVRAILGIGG